MPSIFPVDPRWRDFNIDDGKLGVEATERRGRTRILLWRQGTDQIRCRAEVGTLQALGIQARPSADQQMASIVEIDLHGGGSAGHQATLRKALEACLEAL